MSIFTVTLPWDVLPNAVFLILDHDKDFSSHCALRNGVLKLCFK